MQPNIHEMINISVEARISTQRKGLDSVEVVAKHRYELGNLQ